MIFKWYVSLVENLTKFLLYQKSKVENFILQLSKVNIPTLDVNHNFKPVLFFIQFQNGRGVFFNKDKSFIVWVNEEDHIRIISMQQGPSLPAVWARLIKVMPP